MGDPAYSQQEAPMADRHASYGLPMPTLPDGGSLAGFNLPPALVHPMLRACRAVNTLADLVFYDVGTLLLHHLRGTLITTMMQRRQEAPDGPALVTLNLSALADPEGTILVVDPQRAPFITPFATVDAFLAGLPALPTLRTLTITGVGSSALGSAAFAWNVADALRQPVAAIVPGYGLADLIPQGLGGWCFGLHDWLRQAWQPMLLGLAPEAARIGRRFAADALGDDAFQSGSPESDILHKLLGSTDRIERLYGHSKGALCIEDALRSLPAGRAGALHVTTFGCVIDEDTAASYHQVLGTLDVLGQLNSWFHEPDQWIDSWHTTNTMLPRPMPVEDLVTHALAAR
jgi:hypothetical protein